MNCYCINLDERIDKWSWTQMEASKLGLNPIRFSGTKMPIGHDGCRISHLSLLEQVKDEGVFMIIEDDIKVRVSNPIDIIWRAFMQLPVDWDMFYLGATLNQGLEQHDVNLYRLKKAWATHAIIYNNQNGVVDYILNNHNTKKFSVFLCNDVQFKFGCYMTYPMVATQNPGESDILKHYVDYKPIEDRYKKHLLNKREDGGSGDSLCRV